ncbi:MAG: PAS domain S-box protein [Halobacteria archaeon]|nr:PAS domain S-box protein [Halobacteria archaeon]
MEEDELLHTFKNVNKEIVRAETREELEQSLCEVLAESESYEFVWIGRPNDAGEIIPCASAGIEEGYLDNVSITLDDSPTGEGPTGKAVKTGELQVMQNIPENPDYEPWREEALKRGYKSSVAVPLEYEGCKYGVLNIYADRENAFDESELEHIEELEGTISYAMNSIEAREQLGESKQKYERLATRISDAYYAVDNDWKITYWNEQVGVSTDEVLGKHLWESFPELEGTELEQAYKTAMETKERGSLEAYLGEPYNYWVEVDIYPDEEGLSIFSREITERKEREREIETRNEALQKLHDITTEESVSFDEQVNEVLALGIEDFDLDIGILAEVNGTEYIVRNAITPDDSLEPGDRFDLEETFCELVANQSEPQPVSFRSAVDGGVEEHPAYREQGLESYLGVPVTVDGELYGVLNFSSPEIRNEEFTEGEKTFVRVLAQWISKEYSRQESQMQAKANRDRLRQIIDMLPQLVFAKDESGEYLLANEAVAELYGTTVEELEGATDADFTDSFEEAEGLRKDDLEVIESSEPKHIPRETLTNADGEQRIFETTKIPYEPVEIDKDAVLGVATDITEHEESKRRLERLHEATRQLINAETPEEAAEIASRSSVDILNLPLNGIHLYEEDEGLVPVGVSELTREILGEPPVLDEGIAWDSFETGEPQIHTDVREADEMYNRETPMRSELIFPLGDHGVMIASSTEVDDFDESDVRFARLLATNLEVALDQIQTERVLERNNARLRETKERMEAIIDSSPAAVIFLDTDARVTLWNPAAEEIFGWTEEEALGEYAPFVPDERKEEFEGFLDQLEGGEPNRSVETVRQTKDGEPIDVSISSAAVEVDGEVVGYMGSIEDITERKEYERRLEEQNEQLEVLNRVVRHDIRNDMQIIMGMSSMIKEHIDDEGEMYLEKLMENSEHVVDITTTVRDLMEAMLSESESNERISLSKELDSEIENVRSSHENVIVEVDDDYYGIQVLADGMLESVFRNILKNAVQHNEKDLVRINIDVDDEGNRVVVSIADNGSGIPDSSKQEIFGKGEKGLESEGTGIGLYLVDTLVSQYGGDVWVEDNDNEPEGSVFKVKLRKPD